MIRVGVTGHRDLAGDGFTDLESLRERVRELLVDLAQLAHRSRESHAQLGERWLFDPNLEPLLRVCTPLAMGADQLVAGIALELGSQERGDTEVELAVFLPDSKEQYLASSTFAPGVEAGPAPAPAAGAAEARQRAADDAKQTFERLLASAQVRSTIELRGDLNHDHDADAYSALGELLLGQVDALIAIWNEKEGKRGGTAEVVQRAVALGIPVAVIRPTKDGRAEVRREAGPVPSQPVPGSFLHCTFIARVADLLLFPPAQRHGAESSSHRRHPLRRLFAERTDLRTEFFERERAPAERWFGYPLRLSRCWGRLLKRFDPPPALGLEPLDEACEAQQPVHPFQASFTTADELASYYAGLYRFSFSFLAVLGALAVGFAILGLFHQTWAIWTELAILLVLALTFLLLVSRRWHERFLDYRVLAEQLRQMQFLAPLALSPASTRPLVAYEEAKLDQDWTNRYFRSLVREHGAGKHLILDSDALEARRKSIRVAWIDDQLQYHHRNAHRHERLHERLERCAVLGFVLTLVACILHLLVPEERELWHGVLGFACAFLPAFAAACHAIAAQGEVQRIARRSRTMVDVLKGMRERSKADEVAAAAASGAGARSTNSWRLLARIAEEASRVMLEETVEWRVVLLNHPPHPPG